MTKPKSIFELINLEYSTDKRPKYPEFDVCRVSVGYFSSLEKAEQQLHETKVQKYKFFGFLIKEYPLDVRSFHYSCISKRSYLPDGSLLDESIVSEIVKASGGLEEFFGRPTNKVHFKIGDLVEVLNGDTVTLEIVGNLPRSPDEVQYLKGKIFPDSPFHLDFIDDYYYVFNQYGRHSYPEPVTLFPVRFKVREQLRKKLFSDEYYSYRACYDKEKNNYKTK
jgi:hypothetical protein